MTPSTDAEPAPTEEELCRKIWLLAHSYPAKWVGDLRKPLDARFPTRHNIWTPIWDQMQERVWKEGSRRRLDPCKTLVLNVAPRQNPGSPPNLECPERLRQFQSWLTEYKPPILITFGSVAYRFATRAIASLPKPEPRLTAELLGERFRIATLTTGQINIFPLLHAWVARSGWIRAAEAYSGNRDANYFEFVGYRLADLLLKHGQSLPIWSDYPVVPKSVSMSPANCSMADLN
jgi:hypothetical protein